MQFYDKKLKSFWFGLLAEKIACFYLFLKSYKIIATRYKCKLGEIDIITRKSDTIIFFEIKARQDTSLMDFISKHQKQRIIKAAEHFILTHKKYQTYKVSFDVIFVNKFYWPVHIKNYW